MHEWTNSWPEDPGKYLFYGIPYKEDMYNMYEEPDLYILRICLTKYLTPVHILNDRNWFKEQWGGIGMFTKLTMHVPDITGFRYIEE